MNTKALKLITALRKSDGYIEKIFLNGSCYRFHVFLKTQFPKSEPYIMFDKSHIVTKIGTRLYDIRGLVKKSEEKFYISLRKENLSEVKKWSFAKNNRLKITDCPACGEPIGV